MNYVLGFLFSPDLSKIVLIRKNHPEWQKGKLNGVGGKQDVLNETGEEAMSREFAEEAGMEGIEWKRYARMNGARFDVVCFCAKDERLHQVRTMETETVAVYDVEDILKSSNEWQIENLKWLVLTAIDFLEDGRPQFITATYP